MAILIVIALLLAIIIGPGIWVWHVMNRYSEPEDRYADSGAEIARLLLDRHGLNGVDVEETTDGDHYDPIAKAVRLSPGNFSGRSLTAVTIAAHEVGHALQDRDGYGPLRWRTSLVRLVSPLQKLGAGVLVAAPFLGAVTRVPHLSLLMFGAGFVTLGTTSIVHFVTLPTEFDASFGRALPLLTREKILKSPDKPHARRLLTAAAFTYVSASLMSLLNIARWIAILRR